MQTPIDLRSDTVTLPTPAMRETMAGAEVGDDVYGEDPSICALEEHGADLAGKEAGLFATSGTQSNLLAILCHCQRGDEYIVGQQAHTYKYEGGGAAVLGSVQPQPVECQVDGTLDLDQVAGVIKPDDDHFARTRLLCLENTHNGLALPLEYLERAGGFAAENNLKLHVDGARLWNAAIYHDCSIRTLIKGADTVSLCLSKGLGAPAGSLLCGSREVIREARKWRKMLGGGMRQAGILGAAGLYALHHNIQRLEEDHRHARRLAQGLTEIEGIAVEYGENQTNMVFVRLAADLSVMLQRFLQEHNILVGAGARMRLVTHLGISAEDIDQVVRLCKNFFTECPR